jgi:hypothetical protein
VSRLIGFIRGRFPSRLTHFLDNRLTDGGDVSLARRSLFIPRKIPGTLFY